MRYQPILCRHHRCDGGGVCRIWTTWDVVDSETGLVLFSNLSMMEFAMAYCTYLQEHGSSGVTERVTA